jgi:hypothetical protein
MVNVMALSGSKFAVVVVPPMLCVRHAFEVVDGVVGLVLVAVVHFEVRGQKEIVAEAHEVRRLGVGLSQPALHHQAMFKNVAIG